MRFAHTVVSNTGFRDPTQNRRRLAHLRELLTRLAAERVEFVAIPAGYLTVNTEDEITPAIADIADAVEATGGGVFGGVDVEGVFGGKRSPDVDELTRAARLPYFGFAAFPTTATPEVPIWRQASTTSSNASLAPEDTLPDASRVVAVAGSAVIPLLCGEVFSSRAREATAVLGPTLVLDLGHSGMGQGLIPAMTNLAGLAACPVAHTQHLSNWGGGLHLVSGRGEQQSIPSDGQPFVGDDEFWIGWCVREV